MLDNERWSFPTNSTILADSGFEGYKNTGVVITHKKNQKGFYPARQVKQSGITQETNRS